MAEPLYKSEAFRETFRARVEADYFLEIAIRNEIVLLDRQGHHNVADVLRSYLPERSE